jgi:hypothetical protein|tara:strand:+ start:2095 stop:2268 length:174 start_codon:yes stop_codon:yes gene_type:complete
MLSFLIRDGVFDRAVALRGRTCDDASGTRKPASTAGLVLVVGSRNPVCAGDDDALGF